jgi:hypothetical protein
LILLGASIVDGAGTIGRLVGQIWVPKSQIVALPEGMDALEVAMLEPLGVAIHAVDLAKPRLLEPVGSLAPVRSASLFCKC